jgi:hypothetical protein
VRRAGLLLVGLWLALASSAHAQPRIGGFIEYDNLTYFLSGDDQKINGRNQVIFQTEIRHEADSKVSLFGALEFRFDQSDPARNRVFLDEAYVDLYLGPVDIRLGRQIFAWGRADGFNPTDNLTAWDYSDFLDTVDEQLGLVAALATYYVGDWSLEGVLAPAFTPSVWPELDSRWWPELPEQIPNPAFPRAGAPLLEASYEFLDDVLPDEGLQALQYALRVTGLLGGWDVSVSWFDGYDDLPALHASTAVDSSFTAARVEVEPRYHRRRSVGADFATTLGQFGVHGEAAYYLTADWSGTDPAIDDPYVHFVVGGDFTFADVVGSDDLFLLLEWSQELQVPARGTSYRPSDLNHAFRRSIFGKADLDLSEFSKLTLEGIYNFATEDWYLQPGLVWSFADGVELLVDVDVLGGPPESLFGQFDHNQRLHVRFKYSY